MILVDISISTPCLSLYNALVLNNYSQLVPKVSQSHDNTSILRHNTLSSGIYSTKSTLLQIKHLSTLDWNAAKPFLKILPT